MRKSKKIVGIVLAAIAVIIAVFFIVRGQGAKNADDEPNNTDDIQQEHQTDVQTQSISYDDLKGYILEFTDDYIDEQNSKCYLDDNGKLVLEGEMPKDKAEEILEQTGDNSEIYKSVLKLMPEKLPMSMITDVKCNSGDIELSIESITAGDIELPQDVIPESLTDDINKQLNDIIKERFGSFSDIKMNKNDITIYP